MAQKTTTTEVCVSDYCNSCIHDKHCHTNFEIVYVLDGSFRVNIEGQWVLLTANSGVVIPPLQYHTVIGNLTGYKYIVFSFDKELIPREIFYAFVKNAEKNPVFFSERLASVFNSYTAVLGKNEPPYGALRNAILTEVLYSFVYDNLVVSSNKEGKRADKIKQVIAYIEDHLEKEILLEDLANTMELSQSSLCHMFKEEMHISLKQYILQKKMMYAQTLLQKGATPGAAAAACGYKNYASFYKIFIKVTGSKPMDMMPNNEQKSPEPIA